MSSTPAAKPEEPKHSAPALGVGDLLLTLARHKWLVGGSVILGVVACAGVALVRPPLYVSQAKLLLHYSVPSKPVDPKEVEILTSLDVATQVVATIGYERVLAKDNGRKDPMAAMAAIGAGVQAIRSNSPILTVSFKSRDKDLCQPVLDAVVRGYMLKHLEVYTGPEVLDEYWVKNLRDKLAQTDEQLLQAKSNHLGSPSAYKARIAQAQEELDHAKRELAERTGVPANQGSPVLDDHSSSQVAIPAGTLSDYKERVMELERLRKEERELFRQGFPETHPLVQTVRGQLRNLAAQKAELEKQFPSLALTTAAQTSRSPASGTRETPAQLSEIKRLRARVTLLATTLSNLQAQADQAAQSEPRIAELEERRAHLRSSYESIVTRLAQAAGSSSTRNDDVINISIVQNPSPPVLDWKPTVSLASSTLLGCVLLGLGFAFVRDHVFDRSIRVTLDVERYLGGPVFLAIPRTISHHKRGPFRSLSRRTGEHSSPDSEEVELSDDGVDLVEQGASLGIYAVGLRERVWTYFEVNGFDPGKPKLVGVTGCGRGTGVSTVASNLARELSRAGDGKVLLVDLSEESRSARSLYGGGNRCAIGEALIPERRAQALVQDRLYVACLNEGTGVTVASTISMKFSYFVPKLRASDFDYVVFDMPVVAPTTPTPRLASHLDLTLLVMEAERTDRTTAARAMRLMQQTHSKIATVLNKCRQLETEALGA